MKEVRKILKQILINSLNTDQMNHLARDLDPAFSMGVITGFGDKIVIPRQTAAESILRYFNQDQSLLNFIAYMISRDGQGMSGGLIQLRGLPRLLEVLNEEKWLYDSRTASFTKDQSERRTTDWGYLQEGVEYLIAVASVDVVGSSALVRTNVKIEVEGTLNKLRTNIIHISEQTNGRLWYWHGDGGIIAFYGNSACKNAVLSMLSVLYTLPVFNITENELNYDSDIRLRVGLHYGPIEFKNDVAAIVSNTIQTAQNIEKNCSEANSMSISDAIYTHLAGGLRARFVEKKCKDGTAIRSYRPV